MSSADYKRLFAFIPAQRLLCQEPLAEWVSFRSGGRADCLLLPANSNEIVLIAHICQTEGLPLTILGAGSNVLISGQGVRGVCLYLGAHFRRLSLGKQQIQAEAGCSMAALAAFAARHGLSGLEAFCGIPGTLGGAILMNAGAYEHTLAEVVQSSTFLNDCGQVEELSSDQHKFAYRSSYYSQTNKLILTANLTLQSKEPQEIYAEMARVQCLRRQSQPLAIASAGSAFKRPPGHFAGKLISDAGLKGWRQGDCGVSTQHAGFIVNYGSASPEEIWAVFGQVAAKVKAVFGVELEAEVQRLGEW